MLRILDQQYQFLEKVYDQTDPLVQLIRSRSKNNNQLYLLKIWRETRIVDDYLKKFRYQNSSLDNLSHLLGVFLPKRISFQEQALISASSQEIVSFQSIMTYHHKYSMISENIANSLFKKVIQAVSLIHSADMSLFSLDPTYILIDANLNPVFMNLQKCKELNSICQTQSFYNISKSFVSPQMENMKNKTFDLNKMDSFQAGILGLTLLLCGTSPFITVKDSDSFYGFIAKENFNQFFNSIPDSKFRSKPSQPLKDLIVNLIHKNPQKRITIEKIMTSEWWTSTNQETQTQLFEEYANRVYSLVKMQRQKCKQKQGGENHIFLVHRSDKQSSFSNLTSSYYKGNNYANCYVWNLTLCETFSILINKASQKFNFVDKSQTHFILRVVELQHDFTMQIQAFHDSECSELTIVQYRLLDRDLFYCYDKFQRIIQDFQLSNNNHTLKI